MAKRRVSRIGLTMAVLAGVAAFLFVPSPASACSFLGPVVQTASDQPAGSEMVIGGEHLFTIVGDVEADCSGDYTKVPIEDLVIRVTFTTASGTVVVDVPAEVHPDDGSYLAFKTQVVVDIPDDATFAVVEFLGTAARKEVAITPAYVEPTTSTTTSTLPPSQGRPPAPAPAAPVSAEATFTG